MITTCPNVTEMVKEEFIVKFLMSILFVLLQHEAPIRWYGQLVGWAQG